MYVRSQRRIGTRGSMLIEAVVATGIGLVTLLGALTAFSLLYRSGTENTANIQAAFLTEEGVEAARVIRDGGWSTFKSIPTSTTRYLTYNGTTWVATTTNAYIDKTFERTVMIYDVNRDANKRIVATGTYDANIKKVKTSVSWLNHGVTTTRSLSTYLANVFNE